MKWSFAEILGAGLAGAALGAALAVTPVQAASERPLLMSLGAAARAPIGWREFCTQYAPECETTPLPARDVVLTTQAWNELLRINQWVNETIKPMTDLEHWGVAERWNYPDDGYGDCEDYVLLKRRMLMQAGWPRQALLITLTGFARSGDRGHALLPEPDRFACGWLRPWSRPYVSAV